MASKRRRPSNDRRHSRRYSSARWPSTQVPEHRAVELRAVEHRVPPRERPTTRQLARRNSSSRSPMHGDASARTAAASSARRFVNAVASRRRNARPIRRRVRMRRANHAAGATARSRPVSPSGMPTRRPPPPRRRCREPIGRRATTTMRLVVGRPSDTAPACPADPRAARLRCASTGSRRSAPGATGPGARAGRTTASTRSAWPAGRTRDSTNQRVTPGQAIEQAMSAPQHIGDLILP